MMLDFDRATSRWIYHGVAIGPGTQVEPLEAQLGVVAEDVLGQCGWRELEHRTPGFSLSLAFRNGRFHSGYFWDRSVGGTSWNDAERGEDERRASHEALMIQLFGASTYEDARIRIHLRRDTREYLEQIFFETKA